MPWDPGFRRDSEYVSAFQTIALCKTGPGEVTGLGKKRASTGSRNVRYVARRKTKQSSRGTCARLWLKLTTRKLYFYAQARPAKRARNASTGPKLFSRHVYCTICRKYARYLCSLCTPDTTESTCEMHFTRQFSAETYLRGKMKLCNERGSALIPTFPLGHLVFSYFPGTQCAFSTFTGKARSLDSARLAVILGLRWNDFLMNRIPFYRAKVCFLFALKCGAKWGVK